MISSRLVPVDHKSPGSVFKHALIDEVLIYDDDSMVFSHFSKLVGYQDLARKDYFVKYSTKLGANGIPTRRSDRGAPVKRIIKKENVRPCLEKLATGEETIVQVLALFDHGKAKEAEAVFHYSPPSSPPLRKRVREESFTGDTVIYDELKRRIIDRFTREHPEIVKSMLAEMVSERYFNGFVSREVRAPNQANQ
jgi:hypothetical protein